jgi:hypothetical protein
MQVCLAPRLTKRADWPPLIGSTLFVGMMATGYFYNITFVQLGLVDLGTRLVELEEVAMAAIVAVFALATCAVALLVGCLMQLPKVGQPSGQRGSTPVAKVGYPAAPRNSPVIANAIEPL